MWDSFLNWYHNGGLDVTLFSIVMVILLSFLFDRFMCHVINRIFRGEVAVGQNNRRITLKRVLKNITHYVVAFIAVIVVLSDLGINVVSILAAAGVIGLAVSFGAQSLIKDIFAGFFIIFENQYGVGEYITINNNFTGIVELVGLRITEIRGDNGELIVIPNGSITDVVNYCRGSYRVKETFEISFDSDIDDAERVICDVVNKYYDEHPEDMAEKRPLVDGLDMIGASGVSVCVILWVQPMSQWHVARELRKLVVQALQNEGITIPYPVTELITREVDHGS
ncbi:MAG: mechanosensitive ion channel family protein [Firmicutes bacterium]|nr:mechanosensitive ion channel family protein [Bacillota bacterium]